MKSTDLRLVLNILDIIAFGVKLAPQVMDAYNRNKALVEKIIAEGREPTVEEHETLNAELNALREQLHSGD